MRNTFLLLLVLLAALPVSARNYIRIDGAHAEINITDQTAYYIDTAGNLNVEQFASSGFDPLLIDNRTKVYNFQTMRDAVWTKAFFICESSGTFFIRITPPLLDKVAVYTLESGKWKEQAGGYDASREDIAYHAPVWTFSFHGNAGDTVPVIMRVQSDMPMIFILHAADGLETGRQLNKLTLWNGLFLGIMLLMILYNLFLFVTSKQTVYVHYVFYTLSAGLFVSLASGAANALPEIVRAIHSFSLTLIPACFGVFGMIFTRKFLNTPTYFKRFDYWLYVLLPGSVITFLISLIDRQWGGISIQILGGLFSIVSIYAGIKVWRAGYKPALYYVLGFGTYMICLLVYILLGVVEVDTGDFAPYWLLMIGSATEAVILSFAIGDKLNIATKEKLEADRDKLNALSENERIIREQNVMLEKKVDERTAEIQLQKTVIEEKNKDILDSIHYAKRIQRALLASETLLNDNLPDHFVFYKPKDIVSGDFYWADKLDNGKFLMLTGDCTGHGVPGAFMSLLNISLLHEFSVGQKVHRPDLLLNRQRDAIIAALNPPGSTEISKDGMDCVLISLDFVNRKMQFACANNPLWIMRDGALIEYKGDKMPIGVHEGTSKPFALHEFDLRKGDIIYTFTDGFADQFGGPKGKKYKYSRLKGFLTSIAEKPAKHQLELLHQEFNAWRGELEQVDDILVIGIRI